LEKISPSCPSLKETSILTYFFMKDRISKMEALTTHEVLIEEALTRPIPTYMPRHPQVLLRRGRADVLVGMRRTGKTYGLWETLAQRLAAGVPRRNLLFIDMEDDRLGQVTAQTLNSLLETYFRLVPTARRGPCVLCFDEIQAAQGWERFIRRLLDTENAQILLSGSSAKLLSTEIATSLRGRAWRVEVFPYSFMESLRHAKKGKLLTAKLLGPKSRSALAHHARHYLQVGGFPEVQDESPSVRRQLLKEYVDVVLLRDIIERHKVSNIVALRYLTRRLLGDPAGLFSVNKFYNDLNSLGVKCAKDTLYAYFDHLNDVYLVHTLPLDTRSERERQSNPRKIYANDTALSLNYKKQSQIAWGALLETWVFLHLRRFYRSIAYVRTPKGYEVDFIVRNDAQESLLVQVCATYDDPKTLQRELRALADAHTLHPQATMLLVTLDTQATVEVAGKKVAVVPIWRWTLSAPQLSSEIE
jgi:predicted AAA+ superfamily ATPase